MDFPGFMSIYRDNDGYIELYFYSGIYDDAIVYQELNDDKIPEHTKTINSDNSILYKLKNKNIKKIRCLLISTNKDIENKEIYLKI